MGSHYLGLHLGYALGLLGWWALFLGGRRLGIAPAPWGAEALPAFARPWREVGLALAGVVGVVGVGQLWSRGALLPARGSPWLEAVNQLLIFLPLLAVPFARGHGPASMLLPRAHLGRRLAAGLALAFVALAGYAAARRGSPGPLAMAARIAAPENVDELVQVLLEDVGVGILLVRLAAAMGARRAVVATALLFAAGHVPAMLSGDADAGELAGLLLDFGLGVLVLGTVLRARDVLWLWPVHAALDLTQFPRISG